MSFSARVKDELCRPRADKACCLSGELYGALLLAGVFRRQEIKIITEHNGFALRMQQLLREVFGFAWDQAVLRGKWVLSLRDPVKCAAVWDAYCYGQEHALHLNNAVFEGECCHAAFFRGAFLSGGSVTDPGKEYHLQLTTTHYHLVPELTALFMECSLFTKHMARDGVYALYFKASESIEDFLALTGAPNAAIALMEAKVEKDLRNHVNRKVNCETANLSKTVDAALTQCEAFRHLRDGPLWDTLPQSLQETVTQRLAYPEYTLAELAAMFTLPLGRSGLNHRIRKLMAMAAALESHS